MQQFSPLMTSDSGQAVVIYVPTTVASGSNISDKYPHKQSIGFGITQIVIGGLCIVFNAIDLTVWPFTIGVIGHGIWIGILFIVTGSLGTVAGKAKTKCMIIAYMVMCIISASFCSVLLMLGIVGALRSEARYRFPYYWGQVNIAMESCLAIMALTAAVICIWGAVNCCKADICGSSSFPVPAFVRANYNPSTGQVVYIAQAPGTQLFNDPSPSVDSSNPEGRAAQDVDFNSSKDPLLKADFLLP